MESGGLTPLKGPEKPPWNVGKAPRCKPGRPGKPNEPGPLKGYPENSPFAFAGF